MSDWRLAAGAHWLDERRLAGGSPYAVLTLTDRGARTVRDLLDGTPVEPGPAVGRLLDRLQHRGYLLPPSRRSAASVTVVVPARSAPGPVQAVVDAVPRDVPVVVVDDRSPEPLGPRLSRRAGDLRVVRHEGPPGPAAARNHGASYAGTDWVLFADSDVLLPDGWLATLLDHADGAIAAAPRIRGADGPGLAAWVERVAPALDLGDEPAAVGPGRPVPYVPSAVLLVRRDAFAAAGGFDETLRVGEDVDLVWRLVERGDVRYVPEVVVQHRPRSSAWQVVRRRFDYGGSAALLAARHPGRLVHVDVTAWTAVPWALWLLGRRRLALLGYAATVVAAPVTLRRLPPLTALRLAAHGQIAGTAALSRWLVRPGLPMTVLGLALPGVRRSVAWALLPGILQRVRREHDLAAAVAHLVDDTAYSLGVWTGAVRHRRWEPVRPRVRWGRTQDAS